jgi:hypothetical protein
MNDFFGSEQPVKPRLSWKNVIWTSSIILGLSLVSCGGSAGGSISGQVSVPAQADVKNTIVVAFVCNNDCKLQTDLTNTVGGKTTIGTGGSSANYQIPGVPGGKYLVVAAQDTNGDGKLGIGDLAGTSSTSVTPPNSSVNIQMQAITQVSAGTSLQRAILEGWGTGR